LESFSLFLITPAILFSIFPVLDPSLFMLRVKKKEEEKEEKPTRELIE
jgi:hypothetical protein